MLPTYKIKYLNPSDGFYSNLIILIYLIIYYFPQLLYIIVSKYTQCRWLEGELFPFPFSSKFWSRLFFELSRYCSVHRCRRGYYREFSRMSQCSVGTPIQIRFDR